MANTLAFDVYGTLINTEGVLEKLVNIIPQQANEVIHLWRGKQLEYTFRRGLMQTYVDFDQCTLEALKYALSVYDIHLKQPQIDEVMSFYHDLPAFDDALTALQKLNKSGVYCVAFSNSKT